MHDEPKQIKKGQEQRFPKCQSQVSKSLLVFITLELWLFSAEPPAEWYLVDSMACFASAKLTLREVGLL